MRFFDVRFMVTARESTEMFGEASDFEARTLVVRVEMGDNATPEDAVQEVARKLEKLCNDVPPYEGG